MKKEAKKQINILLIASIIIILALLSYTILNKPNNTTKNQESTIRQLTSIEVKDYKGEKLSSIEDFRENSIKGVQYIDKSTYKLTVDGLVEKPKEYTYNEIIAKQNYEKIVTLHCVEGWDTTILWRGILVRDILNDLNLKENSKVVILHAADGYTTQYPIEYFYNNDIIMAYMMNNVTIPPERGFPFQLVAEDRWGYKWIKWIIRIEISDDTNYKGYWESRGYAKEGNLNESFFD